MRKKIFSLLIVLFLMVSMMPIESFAYAEENLLNRIEITVPEGAPVFYEEGAGSNLYLRQGVEGDTTWKSTQATGFNPDIINYYVLCNYTKSGDIQVKLDTAQDTQVKCKITDAKGQTIAYTSEDNIIKFTAATCKMELDISKGEQSKAYTINFYKKAATFKFSAFKVNGQSLDATKPVHRIKVGDTFSLEASCKFYNLYNKIKITKLNDDEFKPQEKAIARNDNAITADSLSPGTYLVSLIDKAGVYTHTIQLIAEQEQQSHDVRFQIVDNESKASIDAAEIVVTDSDKNKIEPNAEGIYKLVAGTYKYVVSKEGYFTESGDIIIEDKGKDITVSMTKAESTEASTDINWIKGTSYASQNSQVEWTASKYKDSDDVFISEVTKLYSGDNAYFVVNGALTSPYAMVEIQDCNGKFYDVSYSVDEGKRIFSSKVNFFGRGVQHVRITVSDGGKKKENEFILNVSDSASILDLIRIREGKCGEVLNDANQPVAESGSNGFLLEASLPDGINSIKLQIKRNGSEPTIALMGWMLGDWFTDDENWVRVNNGPWTRVSASKNIEKFSSLLNLKQGINIIDIKSCRPTIPYTMKEEVGYPSSSVRADDTYLHTLLIDCTASASTEKVQSSGTIKEINAKQWIVKKSIPMDKYPVETGEDGSYKLLLPESMRFPYVVLAVYPDEPTDTIEVEGALGEQVGNNFVVPVNNQEQIKITIKSSDNTVSKEYVVHLERKSNDAYIESLQIENGTLTKDFARDDLNYFVTAEGNKIATIVPTLSEGASMTVNGKPVKSGTSIQLSADKTIIEITAANTVTKKKYIFFNENVINTGVSKETKERARAILEKGFLSDKSIAGKKHYNDYWEVFKAEATGIDMHNCTFSVKPLEDCTQATDYGATILQLIIMGENPYDYKGSNYVEALANDQTHTYANDIFRLLAYTAAGYNYDEELVDTVKAKAKSKSFDLDMRGWSLIAISSLLDKEETLGIAEAFKEKAETKGHDTGMFVGDYGANAFTQGCVISGLVSAGVDIGSDDWHFNDIDPLAVIENYYVSEEGKIYQVNPKNKPFYWGTVACDYNKDMIIALGDIVQGSSVWQRQALTRQKFDSLVEKATALSKGNKGTEAQKANVKAKLQAAQAAANGVGATEIKGLGSSYYALYEAMSKIDASMKLTDPNAKKVSILYVDGLKKTEYSIGEAFDPNGLSFKVTYEDESTEFISFEDVELLGFETEVSGKKSIRFLYKGVYSNLLYITVRGNTSETTDKVTLLVKDPSGQTYYPSNDIAIEDGETAYSILQKTSLDISFRMSQYGIYVDGINGLYEFDKGKGSGWMYSVNGVFPSYSAANYKLKDRDVVKWLYTINYGKDIGAGAIFTPDTSEAVTTTGTSGSATTAAPTEVKVSGTTATVTVTKENAAEMVKQATENKSAEIVLRVSAADTKNAEMVKLQLETSVVKDVVNKTSADLTVETPNGTVTLEKEILSQAVSEGNGSTITLEVIGVKKPTAEQKKAAGENAHVIQLVLKSGNKVISLFNKGQATVKVEIPARLKDKKVAAVHIGDDDTLEQLAGRTLTIGGKKYYEFTTPHFSTFALVDAEELGMEVEEPQVDAKALTAKLTPVARSAKTAKKNVKVTVSLDKQDKAIIKELKDAGYTVKYRFYRSTKKAAGYKAAVTKKTASYTNTSGKKGMKYFYKVQVRVYDENGKLVAKTALKQCKYASRTWTKVK